MIPISSPRLNSKLAGRSLLNEGRSNKRSCVCLLMGMVLGVCLAGIIFYSSLPYENYRNNSMNLMRIIGLEVPSNASGNGTLNLVNVTRNLEELSVTPTLVT
ncbi:glycoprotein-N-acetylgalactosamine 3-beta-galactosyltransferase 1 [Drosophila eugracilis]|uniref:glycoprotein-N-acetylgalactosamine 3-beta-galactosyltransferase 1 n=1 Tax=Drosophila eugracilis TaxID=29029 RepID=UPI0007E73474|nr:glycoprotein-N-acetylgalactosamine 3-beta-galactosyltransferase 1 [Drosophila eugracilis]